MKHLYIHKTSLHTLVGVFVPDKMEILFRDLDKKTRNAKGNFCNKSSNRQQLFDVYIEPLIRQYYEINVNEIKKFVFPEGPSKNILSSKHLCKLSTIMLQLSNILSYSEKKMMYVTPEQYFFNNEVIN